jgi:CcmD family protein
MDIRNFTYMFYGFLAAWLILIGYVLLLVSRESNIKRQVANLKGLLEERQESARTERNAKT